MKCNRSQRSMHKIDRRNEMAELYDSAADGQMADYISTELSGDNGFWNLGIVEYHRPKETLKNYLFF